jgi:hypothetical protein
MNEMHTYDNSVILNRNIEINQPLVIKRRNGVIWKFSNLLGAFVHQQINDCVFDFGAILWSESNNKTASHTYLNIFFTKHAEVCHPPMLQWYVQRLRRKVLAQHLGMFLAIDLSQTVSKPISPIRQERLMINKHSSDGKRKVPQI